MMDRSVVAERPMAKKQRTIQLPGDILLLADAYEERTGVRFNRQLLAALIQYFFSDPRGPDPLAMQAAVKVETGDLPFDDVATWLTGQRGISALIRAQKAPDNPKMPDRTVAVRDMHNQESMQQQWRNIARIGNGSLVGGLVKLWQLGDGGMDVQKIIEAPDLDVLADFPFFAPESWKTDAGEEPKD
jgi:hypothetical protein